MLKGSRQERGRGGPSVPVRKQPGRKAPPLCPDPLVSVVKPGPKVL